ncbi:MAG: hypothetical protein KID00_07100 [Clostridium argentinense]|uniref:Uncharacterized protein n=1 Tax=Clostridium faecium TaxID=2762223 RepID=A0ABR8YWG7_9CLOT|nr:MULTISPECIES: hypothetical protein [Clostridium]MBD8048174.1 hypothetical protein [Clostridium faecium]MBS5823616.1 hypothetical protein [Clostridium argentinense]MDU1348647.1 hypothetical protein [Clostridium argentinense]
MNNVEEILWLMFKNSDGEKIKVGELIKKESKFYFKYDVEGVKRAEEYGFTPLPNLPRINSKYFREEVFRTFAERVEAKTLNDEEIFDLIKTTGAKLAEDQLEFFNPEAKEEIDEVKDEENKAE